MVCTRQETKTQAHTKKRGRDGGAVFILKGSLALLTDCYGIVDFEAAEHLVDVSGMQEAVSSHHHLERLWLHKFIQHSN